MQVHRAAKRYAKMLYDLASEDGQAEKMNSIMTSLSKLLLANAELSAFVKNCALPSKVRMDILSALFEKRCGELFWKFLRFLEVKRRIVLLEHIAFSYSQIYMKANGMADALIKTPFVLDAGQQTSVQKHLERKLSGKVALMAAEDASLIGGFTILMDWTLYDLSVSGMLESLKRNSLNT